MINTSISMALDGPQRKSAMIAAALITNKVGLMEKAKRKAERDQKKRRAATKTKLIKRALIPGEGSCLKDKTKSGKSIIRTTHAAKAAKDGLGPKPMDKSHLAFNATPIGDVNYNT